MSLPTTSQSKLAEPGGFANEKQPLSDQLEKECNSDEKLLCKLCLELLNDQTSTFTIAACQCTFCKQCMHCYVEVLIHDGIVLSITCPDAECSKTGVLDVHEVKQLVLPETFEMYQRLKFEQEIATDPHRTLCPEAMCSAVCHVCARPATDQASTSFPVSCPTCHLQFCYTCKAKWKPNHKCSNFPVGFGSDFQRLQAKTGFSLSDDVMIKRCPVCHVFIEKNNGCAQMTCRNCSHIFCWYCLKVLDNDFLLRHYDKGPCRDMLGHSRSQIVRHRLGVIALFAAFFLLMIVAFPVLLVVAPFLICYKCRKCHQKTDKSTNDNRTSSVASAQRRSSVVLEVRLTHRDSPPLTSSSADRTVGIV